MRIIGGEFRSRKLLTPRDDSTTRPIPDRVKESVFGLLRAHCEGASVLDAFAGTGALGLEALSRGAARCVFVERDKGAAEILRKNVEALAVLDRAEIVVGDALGPGALARAPRPLTIAFFDPPYPVVRDMLGWKRVKTQLERVVDLLTPDGFAILRTPHPFLLEVQEAPAAGAVPPRPHRRKKKEKRPRNRGVEEWTEDPEKIAAWAEGEDEPAPAPASPAVQHIAGDLALANAIGPETHVYASTAVHLYMRKPGASAPAPTAAP